MRVMEDVPVVYTFRELGEEGSNGSNGSDGRCHGCFHLLRTVIIIIITVRRVYRMGVMKDVMVVSTFLYVYRNKKNLALKN